MGRGVRQDWGPGVWFELDLTEIDRIVARLAPTPAQVKQAMSRALRRTATTLRLRASKAVVGELQLRSARSFRRRLKDMRFKLHKSGGEIGVWIGLNDMAVSQFKGRVAEYGGGATFRSHEYPGAFVAKLARYRSIYKRVGAARFPVREQTYPIKDQIDVLLEDEILTPVFDIFVKNFMSDLRARVLFGVGGQSRSA